MVTATVTGESPNVRVSGSVVSVWVTLPGAGVGRKAGRLLRLTEMRLERRAGRVAKTGSVSTETMPEKIAEISRKSHSFQRSFSRG